MNIRNFHLQGLVIKIMGILLMAYPMSMESQERNFPEQPKREVRAVWLTTIGGLDWPHSYSQSERSAEKQKNELRQILDQYERIGINTVLVQTRIRATVIYPSDIEPWDGCLSGFPGTSPGYDALSFIIDECHKRGMEIHAWIATMPLGRWDGYGCKLFRRKHPSLARKIDGYGYMNPEASGTGDYLADLCEEITKRYDIDGIHLDYIRYPETWKIKVSKDQGRQYITSIVRKIHDKVKAAKPWVKMSCSPVGKYDDLTLYWSHGWNANDRVCQDAQGWLRDGLMDELFPMMYFRDNQFFPFAIDWKENDYGKIVAPGLGIYFLHPKEANWPLKDIVRELYGLRDIGLGQAFFRGKFLTDNVKGLYNFMERFNTQPSLVPAMTWESEIKPATPQLYLGKKTQTISYHSEGDVYYNIYVDGQLTLARTPRTSLHYKKGHQYAICAMNRYGNESAPVCYPEIAREDEDNVQEEGLLHSDGLTVYAPLASGLSKKDLIMVTTIQGTPIAYKPWRGTTVDVRDVKDGFYCLKSVNKKGKTHRLGFFQIRRFLRKNGFN